MKQAKIRIMSEVILKYIEKIFKTTILKMRKGKG